MLMYKSIYMYWRHIILYVDTHTHVPTYVFFFFCQPCLTKPQATHLKKTYKCETVWGGGDGYSNKNKEKGCYHIILTKEKYFHFHWIRIFFSILIFHIIYKKALKMYNEKHLYFYVHIHIGCNNSYTNKIHQSRIDSFVSCVTFV